jgi:hypothetical protein
VRLEQDFGQALSPVCRRLERGDQHRGIEIGLHQADAIAPQLVITVAARFNIQEQRDQQRVEDDQAMESRLGKGDGQGSAS